MAVFAFLSGTQAEFEVFIFCLFGVILVGICILGVVIACAMDVVWRWWSSRR